MPLFREQIGAGVTLHIIPTDKFKTNYLSVNFIMPLAAKTASAYALIPPVLGRGAEKYQTMRALNLALSDLYAANISVNVSKKGEYQIISFTATFLDDTFVPDGTDVTGGTLGILEQLLLHPKLCGGAFDPEYVAGEKKNLCDTIRARINNKSTYAIQRGNQEMCRDEAYAVDEYGTVEQVEKLTPDALYTHYRYLLSHAPVQVYYVGRHDRERVKSAVSAMLADLPRAELVTAQTKVRRRASGQIHSVTEKMPVNQGKLTVCFRTGKVLGDGDYYKFVLFNEIFGASPFSKLFMNVREKQSLCYYCSSVGEPLKGIMSVASGVEPSKKDAALTEILHQLDAMRAGDISDEEMENAKRSVCNAYREIGDSAQRMEHWYLLRGLCGIDTDPAEASRQIMQVTREDVVAVAQGITLDTVYFLKGEEAQADA